MDTDPEHDTTHAAILSIFQALDQGDITAGRAVYRLGYQAAHWADEPALAALYRQQPQPSDKCSARSAKRSTQLRAAALVFVIEDLTLLLQKTLPSCSLLCYFCLICLSRLRRALTPPCQELEGG